MADNAPTADELRAAADHLEEPILAAEAATPPLAIGDAQNFPRPAPDDRRAPAGQSQAEERRAIAELRRLADALDAGETVSQDRLEPVAKQLKAYRKAHP